MTDSSIDPSNGSIGYGDAEAVAVSAGDRVSVRLPFRAGSGDVERRSFRGEVATLGLQGEASVRLEVSDALVTVPARSDYLTVLGTGSDD